MQKIVNITRDGSLRGRVCFSSPNDPFGMIIDYSVRKPTRYEAHTSLSGATNQNSNPYKFREINRNCDLHAPYVSEESCLARVPKPKHDTAILLGAGPSARNAIAFIDSFGSARPFAVAGVNLGIQAVGNPDFAFVYEALANDRWWRGVDPKATTLCTSPMSDPRLIDHWGGENTYYSYLWEMPNPDAVRWQCLQPLVGMYTTATYALNALRDIGFKRILLAGFDFMSISSGEEDAEGRPVAEFYFDGTSVGASWASNEPHLEMYGINAVKGYASEPLYSLANCMKTACEICSDSGVEIINCSEQGILDIERCEPIAQAMKLEVA